MNDKAINDSTALGEVLSGFKPGDRVSAAVTLPEGSTRTVGVTLGERPTTI